MLTLIKSPSSFQVKTPRGFVGSRSLNVAPTDSMPQAFGYAYPTREAAAAVAAGFAGAQIVEVA
jgi:hypothetical protein